MRCFASTASQSDPLAAAYARAWSAPLRAAPALVVLLVLVHVGTAALGVAWGRPEGWGLLVFDRPPRFRAMVGGQTAELLAMGQRWRWLTSVFLHGDGLHLALNASSLWVLGRLCEPQLGALRWSVVFVLGGLGGSLASSALGVQASDGASGGAFALLALACVWGWRFRSRLAPEDARLHGPILTTLLLANLVLSVLVPVIDVAAHLGGMVVGIGAGWLWTPRY